LTTKINASKIYLINNDNEVIDLLNNQFKNIKTECFDLKIEYAKNNKETIKDELTNIQKFILFLSNLESGKYKKSWCGEQAGFKVSSYFYNKILKNKQVLLFMKDNNILVSRYFITVA
jgi:hypothetical protein